MAGVDLSCVHHAIMTKLGTARSSIPVKAWKLFYLTRAISLAFFAYHSAACTDIVIVQEADVAKSKTHPEAVKAKPGLDDVKGSTMSRILFVLVLLCVSKVRTKHLTNGLETNSKTFAIILQALGWDSGDTARMTPEQKRAAMTFLYHAFHAFDVATVLRHALQWDAMHHDYVKLRLSVAPAGTAAIVIASELIKALLASAEIAIIGDVKLVVDIVRARLHTDAYGLAAGAEAAYYGWSSVTPAATIQTEAIGKVLSMVKALHETLGRFPTLARSPKVQQAEPAPAAFQALLGRMK
eukprot:1155003-Amphidinium_carterae.1